MRFLNLAQWENMQRVELEVEKHVREGEKDKNNQQAVLFCHALVMTLYYPFENNFYNYMLLRTKTGFTKNKSFFNN